MGGSLAGKSTLLLKRSPPASAPAYDRRSCQSQSALTTGTVLWARYLNLPWYMCVCVFQRGGFLCICYVFSNSLTHIRARAHTEWWKLSWDSALCHQAGMWEAETEIEDALSSMLCHTWTQSQELQHFTPGLHYLNTTTGPTCSYKWVSTIAVRIDSKSPVISFNLVANYRVRSSS